MKELSIADLYAINTIATNALGNTSYSFEYFEYLKVIQIKSNEELTERLKRYYESLKDKSNDISWNDIMNDWGKIEHLAIKNNEKLKTSLDLIYWLRTSYKLVKYDSK